MLPTRGVPRLTTSAVASVDSIGRRADAYWQLRVPIALEKGAEAVVAPVVAARNGDSDRRPAHQEAALRLVVEHRDELGAIVGLAAQRLPAWLRRRKKEAMPSGNICRVCSEENGVRTCRVERPGQPALPQAAVPTAPLDISPPSAGVPSPPPPERSVFQFGPLRGHTR